MISNKDFNDFLRQGYITGLQQGSSMSKLLKEFGPDIWYVKNTAKNGLIYGIIKLGITEFHIYNEKISGISYRPNIFYSPEDYSDTSAPWIIEQNKMDQVESKLANERIKFKKYEVCGPVETFETAGAQLFLLEEGSHIFIDTEGGVSFLFEFEDGNLHAYQICRYYKKDIG